MSPPLDSGLALGLPEQQDGLQAMLDQFSVSPLWRQLPLLALGAQPLCTQLPWRSHGQTESPYPGKPVKSPSSAPRWQPRVQVIMDALTQLSPQVTPASADITWSKETAQLSPVNSEAGGRVQWLVLSHYNLGGFFFFSFLAMLQGLLDLSSLIRDWTRALGSESAES